MPPQSTRHARAPLCGDPGERPAEQLMLVIAHASDPARVGERWRPASLAVGFNRVETAFPGGPLEDSQLSRRHAEFRAQGSHRVEVRDVGSRNGTFVDSRQIGPGWTPLLDGQVVRVGSTLLVVRSGRTVVRASPTTALLDPAAGALVGVSDAIRQVRAAVARHGPQDGDALVVGPTGVGKGAVARELARLGRPGRPFVTVSTVGATEGQLEARLFGHVRRAFTGPEARRAGALRRARGGTLFVDGVGHLGLGLQRALVRALGRHEVPPVGADRAHRVDVRFVAGVSVDPVAAAQAERLDRGLYARVERSVIRVPPLAARVEDVPSLACHFALRLGRRPVFRVWTLVELMQYSWPFNLCELESAVAHMVRDTPESEPLALPTLLRQELVRRRRALFDAQPLAARDGTGAHRLHGGRAGGRDPSSTTRASYRLEAQPEDYRP